MAHQLLDWWLLVALVLGYFVLWRVCEIRSPTRIFSFLKLVYTSVTFVCRKETHRQKPLRNTCESWSPAVMHEYRDYGTSINSVLGCLKMFVWYLYLFGHFFCWCYEKYAVSYLDGAGGLKSSFPISKLACYFWMILWFLLHRLNISFIIKRRSCFSTETPNSAKAIIWLSWLSMTEWKICHSNFERAIGFPTGSQRHPFNLNFIVYCIVVVFMLYFKKKWFLFRPLWLKTMLDHHGRVPVGARPSLTFFGIVSSVTR